MAGKLGVVIVDDSALIRQLLTKILSSDPGIEVLGAAHDPLHARQMIKEVNPDVITLDVEMPKMDGITFLDKIMRLRPMPVVMISTLTQKQADITLQALEMGAVDFVAKPTIDMKHGIEEKSAEIIEKVKAAGRARVQAHSRGEKPAVRTVQTGPGYNSTQKIVAIGASTGGVEALKEVVCGLPSDCPATMIVQHMPGGFTKSFAERLNAMSSVDVSEATDGTRVLPGHVYIAPGTHHMELVRSGGSYMCKLHDGPLVTGHRPAADVLFTSVAKNAGQNAVGVILTGMGKDGAKGLKEMRDAGASTIGQDEATALVYGMPKVAFELGGVEKQVGLTKVASEIIDRCNAAS